jgi:CubicO group peptidase (beta-lactamase class C family)
MRLSILFIGLLCAVSYTLLPAQTLYFPPKTGNVWQTIPPQDLGFCPDRVDSLYAFLERNNSKSFVLLKDGKVVLEKYFGTFVQDSFWYWASAGKSLTAFLVGQAQQEGLLKIQDPSAQYLGKGWTSCPPEKEALITVRNQLTMTNGLDDNLPATPSVPDPDNCKDPECLKYKADAGTRWAYHNAPYTLLHNVVEKASGLSIQQFTKTRVYDRTGMRGLWLNGIQYGRARDMARFGLLILAKGVWNGDTLLRDKQYFYDMTHPSQDINKSYGYLWWLNGQSSFMLPSLQIVFPGKLCPNAPDDMFAALGKNDQKIHVVPSKGWVVVRQGNASNNLGPGGGQVPTVFDNQLWAYLNALTCKPLGALSAQENPDINVWPNPAHTVWNIESSHQLERIELFDGQGRRLHTVEGLQASSFQLLTAAWPAGLYCLRIYTDRGLATRQVLKW